ncbi:hypothetical protein Ais01nite_29120 [Asanoa ishikariensis]|uniref:Uncharacterized protein n=1 Tax=Asanoa ishikariensis TaxID=137265 RepID=A0A1H3QMP9_9ACTN|nr:hypothetical protein [Asanoa ishikariensis]GIF64877.1 hypothetical protein Ais01nite_29120 [Asanoa ishikariensis]SDZ14590.1 hypothetical protein SAMN05421684_3010 [Asanoa ishikariensis]
MAYVLEAVIGGAEVLRLVAEAQPLAVVAPLPNGMALVPMTDELFAAYGARQVLGFEKLPADFEPVLATCSSTAPVAYVEAEFFGGEGTQRAALWQGGALSGDPVSVDEDEPFGPAGSPISQTLRRLGVDRGDRHDEFEALDLGRHCSTNAWLR